jgi:hypothetical protein
MCPASAYVPTFVSYLLPASSSSTMGNAQLYAACYLFFEYSNNTISLVVNPYIRSIIMNKILFITKEKQGSLRVDYHYNNHPHISQRSLAYTVKLDSTVGDGHMIYFEWDKVNELLLNTSLSFTKVIAKTNLEWMAMSEITYSKPERLRGREKMFISKYLLLKIIATRLMNDSPWPVREGNAVQYPKLREHVLNMCYLATSML